MDRPYRHVRSQETAQSHSRKHEHHDIAEVVLGWGGASEIFAQLPTGYSKEKHAQ